MNADTLHEAIVKTLLTWCECCSLEKIEMKSLDLQFFCFFSLLFNFTLEQQLQEWL